MAYAIKTADHAHPQTHKSRKVPLAIRHAAKVDTSAGPDACHLWTASIMQSNGYGQVRAPSPITGDDTMRCAHVIAWELHHGRAVPNGKMVLHAHGCAKTCCNPRHLRLGTAAENMADAKAEKHTGRRLSKAGVLEIVHLRLAENVSVAALGTRFAVDVSTVRNIMSGKVHSKLTGIERNRKQGGRPRKLVLIIDNTMAETGPVNTRPNVATMGAVA